MWLTTLCFAVSAALGAEYSADWDSLDQRPIPSWFDEAKFGIMIHWGVYSVPSFGTEQFWRALTESNETKGNPKFAKFMKRNYPPGFTYHDLANAFKAEFYNATKWIDLFVDAGAKYAILTSKHHDGYTLWPSKFSPGWNSMEVGPKRDLLGEFAKAIKPRGDGFRLGIYHSLLEWYNPILLKDKSNNFTTREYAQKKVVPEMMDIIERFEPDIFWSDGQWGVPRGYYNETAFLAWLFNVSPVRDTVVTNDRWVRKGSGKYRGGILSLTKYPPQPIERKWDLRMTLDLHSWAFRKEAKLDDVMTSAKIIEILVITVSKGGNLVLGIGPSEEGLVTPIYEETLREVGAWLQVYGEAIYGSTPAKFENDLRDAASVWYTKRDNFHYAIILVKPKNNVLHLARPKIGENTTVSLVGFNEELTWRREAKGLRVVLPEMFKCAAPEPWVLKLTQVIDMN